MHHDGRGTRRVRFIAASPNPWAGWFFYGDGHGRRTGTVPLCQGFGSV